MATARILLAEEAGLAPFAPTLLGDAADAPKVVPVQDGARCLTAFTKLVKARQPPLLVVLDDPLPRVTGRGTATAMRAIERGLGLKPTPVLFYTAEAADESLKALLSKLGRAVHLQRPADEPPAEQARRLGVAVGRLLAQLRGK